MTAGMGAGGQRINPVTGVPEYQEQNGSWRPFNPAWLRGGAGNNNALGRLTDVMPPANTPVPDGYEWVRGTTGWEQRPKSKEELTPKYTDPDKPPTSKAPAGFVWRYNGKFWEQSQLPLAGAVPDIFGPGTAGGGGKGVTNDPLNLFGTQ